MKLPFGGQMRTDRVKRRKDFCIGQEALERVPCHKHMVKLRIGRQILRDSELPSYVTTNRVVASEVQHLGSWVNSSDMVPKLGQFAGETPRAASKIKDAAGIFRKVGQVVIEIRTARVDLVIKWDQIRVAIVEISHAFRQSALAIPHARHR